jgi:hypothetical protein
MAGQERADLATAMDRAAIPQQINRTAEMTEQMLEKGADIEAAEISRPTPEVERQASPSFLEVKLIDHNGPFALRLRRGSGALL